MEANRGFLTRSPFLRCAGAIPESIGSLTNLQQLWLFNNKLSGARFDSRTRSARATRWKRIGDFSRVPRSHEERRSSRKTAYRDTCSETFRALSPCSPLSSVFLCSRAQSPRKTCGSCSPGAETSTSETTRPPLAAPCCSKRGSGSIGEARRNSSGPRARGDSCMSNQAPRTPKHTCRVPLYRGMV